ncbi:prepilin-type N-terminal cleavage/methylation domain-containing protein [Sulfurimonas sp.]|jgi:prepilin-type N-terminal cleavage/methylation domain-containing protein|uniref:prepilin-type N-terminal cleavage/methylation domain-containing protein n=1 Tax=Sulfurimonas sp. TaxID=2022749 RepID=UPI0025FB50AD|nr:prepilin-type N-terminal cleavage/methylation domain-containing protein [Sulfurimonas sp.]MBT5934159.1 prepilin-type N-terminal cleavage/methylation domain-containing protein [Sulfurimonas sp.]
MKKAFTMIEFVFVIVVIGIIAAVVIPSIRTNPLQEAAIQLLSHIKYTQHLAMVDDKYDASDADWYKGRWQLVFSNSKFTDYVPAYTIFADRDWGSGYGGDAIENEMAKNPENSNQVMTGGYGSTAAIDYTNAGYKGMKKLNLGKSYGVLGVNLDGGCKKSRIAFDHLGRPLQGDQSSMTGPYSAGSQRLIVADCNVTLSNESDQVSIIIRPETGYSSITF